MENLVISTNKKFTMDKFFSEIKVTASEDIAKILNTSVKTIISTAEIANGVLSVSGKNVVSILYLNAEGIVCSADGISDFTQKQKFDAELSEIFVTCDTLFEGVNFSGNEATCSLALMPQIEGEYKYQIPAFAGENSDYVTDKNSLKVNRLVSSPEDSFAVAEEFEISQKEVQILAEDTNVIISEASCTVDKIVFEGKVITEIIAKEAGEVFSLNKEFEFRQEISAENVVPNMSISSKSAVRNVKITPEVKDEKTVLACTFEIFAKAYVYEEITSDIVTDIFSLSSDVDITYDYIEAKSYFSTNAYSDTILSQTNITEVPDFDDIIGVYAPEVKILDVEEANDKFIITSIVSAYALYKSTESTNKLNVSSEIKFEVAKQNTCILDGVKATAIISSYKVKAGKELEVVFSISYDVTSVQEITSKFVKSFEEKGKKSADDFGVKVYITKKGQTLFDVAKILNIKPETIEAQNVVDGAFEQGQKIYVYSPINLA